jgi:hypothetical protein
MFRDWEAERDSILKWIESQHKAITITSFEWEGFKFEHDGFWYIVDGEEFPSWEHAIDYVITLKDMGDKNMKSWKVLFYEVGKEPVVKEINGSLEEMQEMVGGYIEVVRLPNLGKGILSGTDYVVVVNEEGLIKGLKPNRGQLVGNLFVCAIDEEDDAEFRGLRDEELSPVSAVVNIFLPPAPSA